LSPQLLKNENGETMLIFSIPTTDSKKRTGNPEDKEIDIKTVVHDA
jgi:hypothetical protein